MKIVTPFVTALILLNSVAFADEPAINEGKTSYNKSSILLKKRIKSQSQFPSYSDPF